MNPIVVFTALFTVFAVAFALLGEYCTAALFGVVAAWMLFELLGDYKIRRGSRK